MHTDHDKWAGVPTHSIGSTGRLSCWDGHSEINAVCCCWRKLLIPTGGSFPPRAHHVNPNKIPTKSAICREMVLLPVYALKSLTGISCSFRVCEKRWYTNALFLYINDTFPLLKNVCLIALCTWAMLSDIRQSAFEKIS